MSDDSEVSRREKILGAVDWLGPIVDKAAPDFQLWEKVHPEEAEEFWQHWDLFDRASYGYNIGAVPVEKIRQLTALIVKAIERAKVKL